ncbi:MAG: mitochondrial fission ELM1 family protein, partial [Candidatus Omnitrophica bacterium]|nr:mitochondrial fission ELM1 family protein [Candidatus Omnitrophota bacterium]
EALKNNEMVGMTIDQGGKDGTLVNFFGRTASMSTGSLRLALKYGTAILPVFFVRRGGPYVKIILGRHFEIVRRGNEEEDVRDNLQRLVLIHEEHIRRYPHEYLWTYKIWKYSDERNILILSDAKTGHLRQSEAVSRIVTQILNNRGIKVNLQSVNIQFKNSLAKSVELLAVLFSGRYVCQGCLFCLKGLLQKKTYATLMQANPDIVISCGSSLAGINFLIARQSMARSVVILRPLFLGTSRFDLVIMPVHDRPAKRKNIVTVEGALSLIDSEYLKEQTKKLLERQLFSQDNLRDCIGLFIGGDTKTFHLKKDVVLEVMRQLKVVAEKHNKDILITTSRRTPGDIEHLVKSECAGYSACKLMIIANENNIPEAVGGILGLSELVVVSPESISMISEAVSSGKYVVVFAASGLSPKHRSFLDNFAKDNYIRLTKAEELGRNIEEILLVKPQIRMPQSNLKVREALEKIL